MSELSVSEAEQSTTYICWWHQWPCRRWTKTGNSCQKTWGDLEKWWRGNQRWENKTEDQQHHGITANIQVQGQTLATVKSFEYLGAIVTDKVLGRIAQKTAALNKLKPNWKDKNITIRLMRTLVMSICMLVKLGTYSRPPEKNQGTRDEVYTEDSSYHIPGLLHKCGYKTSIHAGYYTSQQSTHNCQEMQASLVWPSIKIIRLY